MSWQRGANDSYVEDAEKPQVERLEQKRSAQVITTANRQWRITAFSPQIANGESLLSPDTTSHMCWRRLSHMRIHKLDTTHKIHNIRKLRKTHGHITCIRHSLCHDAYIYIDMCSPCRAHMSTILASVQNFTNAKAVPLEAKMKSLSCCVCATAWTLSELRIASQASTRLHTCM